MNKTIKYMTILVLFTAATPALVQAHCQVPCGIYDDQMRIHLMEEHVVTIEKAMKQIEASPNMNQTVRWVMNKEKHADALAEIATYYFMAQRIKLGSSDYAANLAKLHEILVYSMKAKQGTDLANVEKLRALIADFESSYLGKAHKH